MVTCERPAGMWRLKMERTCTLATLLKSWLPLMQTNKGVHTLSYLEIRYPSGKYFQLCEPVPLRELQNLIPSRSRRFSRLNLVRNRQVFAGPWHHEGWRTVVGDLQELVNKHSFRGPK